MASLADRINADLEILSDLPSPATILTKLTTTLGRDDVELVEIEEIIAKDPVVTGRVIHAANAAAYAGHSPITSLHNALLRLGVMRVRRLALLVGLFNTLPAHKVPEAFWPHSLAATACAEVVLRYVPAGRAEADPDAVFLAALLHDLGLLVLASHYPKEYRALREMVDRESKPLDEVEDAAFGIDHGAIGARLAKQWLLPPSVCAAIRGHHRIDAVDPDDRANTLIVHLADALCYHVQGAEMGERVVLRPDDPALVELGIQADALTAMTLEAQIETQRAGDALRAEL